MKFLHSTLLILICSLSVMGQKAPIKAQQDSIMKVRLARMEQWEKQRKIYEINYARDPKQAVDSVVLADKANKLEAGQERLASYLEHPRLDTLEEIDLSHSGLTEVPDFVFNALQMKVLLLDYNDIKKLPKELGALDSLKRIYWRGNNLDQYWWIRIQQIEGLEKLDMSNNSLTRLPRGVKHLKDLKELVMDENFLGEVPIKRLSKASFIKEVSFNKSHAMSLAEARYDKLDFLEVLKVNNSKIDKVHHSLYELAGLKELQLQENQIKQMPDGISKMAHLEKLSFYKNELKDLPTDIFQLDLKIIDVYYNQLEVIPDAIGSLSKLEVLFLAHNRIYSLPESVGKLANLKELYLHHNRLSVLPESIDQLTKLKVARVNDNYLIEFPDQFLGMSDLVDLDVSGNQLETLSRDLEHLESLELFNYQENPIDFNSPENGYLSPMIVRMLERGVTCVPRIYREEVSKGDQ